MRIRPYKITMALRGTLCVLTISSLLSGCGISLFSGSGDAKRDTKRDTKSGEGTPDDEKASEPQVVTGTYLTCEIADSAKKKTPSDAAVGCSIMNQDKLYAPASGSTIHFSEETRTATQSAPGTATPANREADVFNLKSKPQALFFLPPSNLGSKTFHAEIFDKNKALVKSFKCDSDKLPCKDLGTMGILPLQLNGSWEPKTSNGAQALMKAGCPVVPQELCDASSNLSKESPYTGMKDEEKTLCMKPGEQVLDKIAGTSHWGEQLAASFVSPPVSATSESIDPKKYCVQKKVSRSSPTKAALVNRDEKNGCAAVLIKSNDAKQVKILIFKISEMRPDIEDVLAGYACPE